MMKKRSTRRYISLLLALAMLLSHMQAARAQDGAEAAPAEAAASSQAEQEEGGRELLVEAIDPASLGIKKLGETEEEGQEDLTPDASLEETVRVSIFLEGKSTADAGYAVKSISSDRSAAAYRESLKVKQAEAEKRIETVLGRSLDVRWNLTLLTNAISAYVKVKEIPLIERLDGVISVERETRYEAPVNDEGADQPQTANTSEYMVGAANAWYQLGYTGAGSRIAIVDTGLDVNHQSVNEDAFLHAVDLVRDDGKTVELMEQISSDLAAQLNSGSNNYVSAKIPYAYNYADKDTRVDHQDGEGNHGSHVTGIAAANRFIRSGSNYNDAVSAVGAVGMAPDAQILVMKVFGSNGGAYDSDYFAAIEDAVVLGADACNLSLGSSMPGSTYAPSAYQEILNGLVGNGTNGHMILSISAGNSYAADSFTSHRLYAEDANFHTGGSPGSYINSLCVASANNTNGGAREDAAVSSFSSWGIPGSMIMKPEITAPGGSIYSLNGTSRADSGSSTTAYKKLSGTSMAAPHIAGLAAVLMQYLKEQAPENEDLMSGYDLRAVAQSLLMSTATPMKQEGTYISLLQQGAGLAEVSRAIEAKSVIMMDDAYLTTETNAAADGKVKVELGDDPARKGDYQFAFTLYNISDKTLVFSLKTDLFTQAVTNGDTLSRSTAMLPTGGVSYEWNGEMPVISEESHDVDLDGDTDDDDARAILNYITGKLDEEDCDPEAADMDGDGAVTSYDAYLLLNWEPEPLVPGGFAVAPHDKAKVTVKITLTEAQREVLGKECGAYLEGFVYVTCTSAETRDAGYDHEHSIPVLGYYGSWTDPGMFDTNSYIENLYGNSQQTYSGTAAAATNYLSITTNGTYARYSGNPYMVEEEFSADRLAIRSDALINGVVYNLIRSAAGTGFAIIGLDEEGEPERLITSAVEYTDVTGLVNDAENSSLLNTASRSYTVNKKLNEYSVSEGDRVRVAYYAIPEYNAMLCSSDMTAADAGTLTDGKFANILLNGGLGKGAFVGYDFTVDDTAPQIISAELNGNTITVSAADDRCLAYVAVLSLEGDVRYAEAAPGTASYAVTFDASDMIANANGYVAVFVGDYAGNEAAVSIQVNDTTHVEREVYVLTNEMWEDQDYLIVSTNLEGSAYALSREGTDVASAAVRINAGMEATNDARYIDSADIAETSVWRTEGGHYLMNGGYYLRRAGSNSTYLQISTENSYNTWKYQNSRLQFMDSTIYLKYDENEGFCLTRDSVPIFLFVKTSIGYDVEPDKITACEVSPDTLKLYKGQTASLSAKVLPLTASDRTVTWSSDNPDAATVDQNGTVTAAGKGTAVIRAVSNADSSKYGECTVTAEAVDKDLNGIIFDETGSVYFSSFNASGLPAWRRLHSEGLSTALQSAFYQDSLYAASMDASSRTSSLYTVDTASYELTEIGELKYFASDIAPGPRSYSSSQGMFVQAYGPYLLAADRRDPSGDVYGIGDMSGNLGSGVFIAGVAARSLSSNAATYYILDENGIIWSVSMNGSSFSSPSKVIETGIPTSFLYQTLYYDGSYLYWGHWDSDTAELIIIDPSAGAVWHAGSFGKDVWPAVGFYKDGAVAPAAEGDEPAEAEPLPEKTALPEEAAAAVEARLAEEAAEDPSFTGSLNMAPAADSQAEKGGTAGPDTAVDMDTSEPGRVTVRLSEAEASHNGLYSVAYDPSLMELEEVESGLAHYSYFNDAAPEKGVVMLAFADRTAVAAGESIAELVFTLRSCDGAEFELITLERNDDVELNESEILTVPGGHNWTEPSYKWAADYSSVTAKRTCTACGLEETETAETVYTVVTEPTASSAGEGLYTAVFANEAFETQTKTVVIPALGVDYELNKTSTKIAIGESEQLLLVGSDGSFGTGSWSSSDESVAEVDAEGVVTALAYGRAVIHVSTDSGYEADCEVQTLFWDVTGSPVSGSSDYQYYYNPVYWAADEGITKGYTSGTYAGAFGVGLDCQRRELMIFLWRYAGKPTEDAEGNAYGDAREMFNDLSSYGPSTDTNKAIAWACKEKITKGYNDGGFHPKDAIVRKDVMILLYRLAGKPEVSGTLSFPDCQIYKPTSDTYKAILWGSQNKITNGYSSGEYAGQFGVNLNCLREQIVTFLYRYDRLGS